MQKGKVLFSNSPFGRDYMQEYLAFWTHTIENKSNLEGFIHWKGVMYGDNSKN